MGDPCQNPCSGTAKCDGLCDQWVACLMIRATCSSRQAELRIPVKLNARSERKPNGIPGRSRTPLERSDAGFSIVQESVRLRQEKPVRSEAEEERAQAEKGVRGKGRQPLSPPQHCSDDGATKRSVLVFTQSC
jgi:hypothetical protein